MCNGTISQSSPTFINQIHVDVHYHTNMYLKAYCGQICTKMSVLKMCIIGGSSMKLNIAFPFKRHESELQG